MTDSADSPNRPASGPAPGLVANVAGFLSAFAGYTRARLELLQLEGKQAAIHVAFILAFGIASALFLLFFWAVLMVALGLLIYSPPPYWYWYIAGVAGAHILLALAVFGLVKLRVLTVSVPTVASTLFLWAALTAGLGLYLHVAVQNLGGVFLVIAALHVLVAALLVLLATLRARRISLRTTLAELQKDREWLNNLKTQSLPKNS
jgi:uncharacterized membrane protein YqjE